MMRKLFFLAVVLIGFGLVFVLAVNPISPYLPEQYLPEQLQFWSTGIGAGFSFLIVVMIILSFFLPFFVYGIYNQTTMANKQLIEITELLQKQEDRFELREQDPNTKSWEV